MSRPVLKNFRPPGAGPEWSPTALPDFDPEAHGWERDDTDRFVCHVGQFWRRVDEGRESVGFVASEKHLNRNGTVHGGMLVTLFDHVLGSECHRVVPQGERMATVQINTQLIRMAYPGEFVTATASVIRATRSLIFVRAMCCVRDEPILSGDAVVKRLRPRVEEGAPA